MDTLEEVAQFAERNRTRSFTVGACFAALGLILGLAMLSGCGVNEIALRQAETECAVADGFARLIAEKKATAEDLAAYAKAQRRAWYAQRYALVGGEGVAAKPEDGP